MLFFILHYIKICKSLKCLHIHGYPIFLSIDYLCYFMVCLILGCNILFSFLRAYFYISVAKVNSITQTIKHFNKGEFKLYEFNASLTHQAVECTLSFCSPIRFRMEVRSTPLENTHLFNQPKITMSQTPPPLSVIVLLKLRILFVYIKRKGIFLSLRISPLVKKLITSIS